MAAQELVPMRDMRSWATRLKDISYDLFSGWDEASESEDHEGIDQDEHINFLREAALDFDREGDEDDDKRVCSEDHPVVDGPQVFDISGNGPQVFDLAANDEVVEEEQDTLGHHTQVYETARQCDAVAEVPQKRHQEVMPSVKRRPPALFLNQTAHYDDEVIAWPPRNEEIPAHRTLSDPDSLKRTRSESPLLTVKTAPAVMCFSIKETLDALTDMSDDGSSPLSTSGTPSHEASVGTASPTASTIGQHEYVRRNGFEVLWNTLQETAYELPNMWSLSLDEIEGDMGEPLEEAIPAPPALVAELPIERASGMEGEECCVCLSEHSSMIVEALKSLLADATAHVQALSVEKQQVHVSIAATNGCSEADLVPFAGELLPRFPLSIGYSLRSLVYGKYRGWWSYLVGSMAGGVFKPSVGNRKPIPMGNLTGAEVVTDDETIRSNRS